MEARDYLVQLGEQLQRAAGFKATMQQGTPARLSVQNPQAAALKDDVLCSPDEHGRLSFQWTWNAVIAPVEDIQLAVDRICYVLRAVGP